MLLWFFPLGGNHHPQCRRLQPQDLSGLGDVAIVSAQSPTLLKVRLKRSQTDQLEQGVDIYVGRTGCPLCPVAAGTAYMVQRGAGRGLFFRFADGSPLTKARFTDRIREILQETGLPQNLFAGHSFRIGAATAAGGFHNSHPW